MKIMAKAHALKQEGVNVEVCNFSTDTSEVIRVNELCRIMPLDKGRNAFDQISEFIGTQRARFDKILIRYPFADKGLLGLVEKFPDTVFFEHNTFELEEMLIVQKRHLDTLKFSLSPSYLKYWYNTTVAKNTVEKQLGAEVLKHAKGGICVTHELAKYEAGRCPGYKTFVVSNGASIDTEFVSEAPQFTNTLRAFMLVGDNAPWQGFERITEGLKRFSDKNFSVEVSIIGIDHMDTTHLHLPPNCKLSFLKKSTTFFETYALKDYHLAFSTLALYKKGMHEAASLKLRDNMLRGFPMVLGYNDTDVSGNADFKPYTLQVPNDSSPLDFARIIDFYKTVRQTAGYPHKIRSLAKNTFSYEVKARQLKAALESC